LKRRWLFVVVVTVVFAVAVNFKHIVYGLGQAQGQFEVLWNARPISDFLTAATFPDSLKTKLALIQEIRQFAIDSLGVNDTENYTTLYDQKGQPILWAVNASPAFEILPYEWCFPIAGCFPYKGYFNKEKAEAEKLRMEALGYDTYLRSVDGWSTLGIFKDPILSNMLNETEGALAELIIHELTHATLFIKDSAAYNESLATFVGQQGALLFLKSKYGSEAEETTEYNEKLQDRKRFVAYVLKSMKALSQLYASLPIAKPEVEKKAAKDAWLGSVFKQFPISSFANPKRYAWTSDSTFTLNNAYFSQFVTYHSEESSFDAAYRIDFNGNFKKYLVHLKAQYAK
jgi:predicted aminopeptidase